MWTAIAEEDMACTECRHPIRTDSKCLSQMPPDMPDGFHRRKYENYCIDCVDCGIKKHQLPCYARRLNYWYASRRAVPESVHCSYCGDPLPEGTRVVSQKLYAWPNALVDPETARSPSGGGEVATGVRATGSGVAISAQRAHSGVWKNLSPKTQQLFRTRGLGRGLGSRPTKMAQGLYNKVPNAVRNQGEGAVLRFLKGKHASHKKSVSKAPGWARRPSNIVWENAKPNLSRGSRNITASEVAAAESVNQVSKIRALSRGVAKGGAIAALDRSPRCWGGKSPALEAWTQISWQGSHRRGEEYSGCRCSWCWSYGGGHWSHPGRNIGRDFADSWARRSPTSRSRGGTDGWHYCPSPVQGESKGPST